MIIAIPEPDPFTDKAGTTHFASGKDSQKKSNVPWTSTGHELSSQCIHQCFFPGSGVLSLTNIPPESVIHAPSRELSRACRRRAAIGAPSPADPQAKSPPLRHLRVGARERLQKRPLRLSVMNYGCFWRRTLVLLDGRVRFSRPKRRLSRNQKENRRKFDRFLQRNAQILTQGELQHATLVETTRTRHPDDLEPEAKRVADTSAER